MRKTIIFGALAALIGLAAVAQANDQANEQPLAGMGEGALRMAQTSYDHDSRNEDARDHQDETGETREHAREGHDLDNDADEGAGHKRR